MGATLALAGSALLASSAYGDLVPATPPTVPVGAAPISVAAADLNGDGKPDLVAANFASDDVSVALATGGGSFAAPTSVPVGHSPISVSAADLDKDGHADLAVANFGTDDVSILLGDGTGSFAAMPAVAAGVDPGAVAVVDVNGDADLDLAVANFNGGDVSVALGNGNGTFGTATSIAVGTQPIAILAEELNGDGDVDLATADYGSDTLSILTGNGDGTFGPTATVAVGSQPIALAAADVNGDSTIDFAAANFGSDDVSVRLGNGDGTFAAGPLLAAPGTSPRAVAFADFDGDLGLDLAVAGFTSATVSFFTGQPGGTFTPSSTPSIAVGPTPIALATTDFDGNTTVDLAVLNQGSSDISILLGFTPPRVPTGVTATAGDGRATISFSPPASDGGLTINAYTVSATPGGATVSGSSSPLTISGLANGTAYAFTVSAANAIGSSASSAPSNQVTPTAPPTTSPPAQAPTAQTSSSSPDIKDGLPPSVPGSLAPHFRRGTLVLGWAPSADNVGVARYELAVDGLVQATLGPDATSVTTRAFRRDAPTTFSIVAVDAAGNRSAQTGVSLVWRARPNVPRLIPLWAWDLLRWQIEPAEERGAAPAGRPVPVKSWYGIWAAWRLQPYEIRPL